MPTQYIISFCALCSAPSVPLEPDCLNCGRPLGPRENRCEGVFNKYDAQKLYAALGWDFPEKEI